jgi:hypothetical protein
MVEITTENRNIKAKMANPLVQSFSTQASKNENIWSKTNVYSVLEKYIFYIPNTTKTPQAIKK